MKNSETVLHIFNILVKIRNRICLCEPDDYYSVSTYASVQDHQPIFESLLNQSFKLC
jgi:hypothetical protein